MIKNKKQIILTSLLTVLPAVAIPRMAYAVERNTMETPKEQRTEQRTERNTITPTEKTTLKQTMAQKTLELRKTSANKEIDRRIQNLQTLIKKINKFKNITADQKKAFEDQINSEITNLSLLKENITKSSDTQTFETYRKQISNSYKIYTNYLPKITILSHADSILNVANLMLTRAGDNLEVKTKIANAQAKVNDAIAAILGTTSTATTENKTELKTAKDLLQEARNILNSARPKLSKPATEKK